VEGIVEEQHPQALAGRLMQHARILADAVFVVQAEVSAAASKNPAIAARATQGVRGIRRKRAITKSLADEIRIANGRAALL
jgi:hypothetical protein